MYTLVGNLCIVGKELAQVGINYITDLYEDSNNMYPFEHWIQKGISPRIFLHWYRIIKIMRIWTMRHTCQFKETRRPLLTVKARDAYRFLSDNIVGQNVIVLRISCNMIK